MLLQKGSSIYLVISLSPLTSGLKRTMALRQPSSVLSIVISCIFVTNSTSTLQRTKLSHKNWNPSSIKRKWTWPTDVQLENISCALQNSPVQNFPDPWCVRVLPRDNHPACKLDPCKMWNWSQMPWNATIWACCGRFCIQAWNTSLEKPLVPSCLLLWSAQEGSNQGNHCWKALSSL